MPLVTHEMPFARTFADRVVFMGGVVVESVVVESGPPEQLFGDPHRGADAGVLKRVV